MAVEVSGPGVTVVVRLEGDLDMSMQVPLLCAFDVARGRTSGSVVVDCSDVDFVDSTALGLIVNAARRLEADGHQLYLVHVPPNMERLLRILNFWETFDRSYVDLTDPASIIAPAAMEHPELLVSFG